MRLLRSSDVTAPRGLEVLIFAPFLCPVVCEHRI
jgi:hypothetical protein